MEEIMQKVYILIYEACQDINKSQDISSKIVGLPEKSFDDILAILQNEGFNNIGSKILAKEVLTLFK
ncbi:hypothetical protein [Richelia sinica]|uniref:hypothetical protein n=1 Tax=Richelia sinica TaxID=1357545 RepID=UPI001687C1AF|nr:hypothetical protein [Richelia sinica]MBD2663890.1 hypothetical protein [Richelia sinica FACHB-800]